MACLLLAVAGFTHTEGGKDVTAFPSIQPVSKFSIDSEKKLNNFFSRKKIPPAFTITSGLPDGILSNQNSLFG
jgi:hypothetical protein